MYKVININIGGRIFQVEENAFETLSNYINSLKTYFSGKPEGNEIVSDIESRIAELLQNKLNEGQSSVTNSDVSEIIASMGSPKDIAGDEENNTTGQGQSSGTEKEHGYTATRSRIYRDPDGKVISGVCSGLSYYFDIDPTIIRLIFIAFFFAGGSSIFIYLILLIAIPEARSTAEKLAMRKEKINIDTIQRSVEEELGKIKNTVTERNYKGKVSGFFQKIFHVIGLVVTAFFRFIGKFMGVIFVIVTISLFLGMISVVTGHSFINGEAVSIFNMDCLHFFENASDRLLSQVTIILMLFSAILVFFYLSRVLLMSKRNFANRKFYNRTIVTILLLAFVLFIISAFRTGSYFHSNTSIESKTILDPSRKSYVIKTDKDRHRGHSFFIENDTLKLRDIELRIEETEGQPELIQIVKSYGQNVTRAKANASNCRYNLTIMDSVIIFPESFIIENNQPYRKQEITFILRLPQGSKFTVDRKASICIMDNSYSHNGVQRGRTYKVRNDRFDCLDCNGYGMNIDSEDYDYSYKVNQIKKLKVSSVLKIRIMKGNTTLIKARGINDKTELVVEENGSSVNIHLKNQFFTDIQTDAEVIVYTPFLSNIEIEGVVDAEIEGFDRGDIEISCSGTSSCRAMLSMVNLIVETDGSAEFTLIGDAENLNVKSEGVSEFDASEFIARHVTANASGASKMEVHAVKSIKAWSYGVSNIYYYGEPESANCVTAGVGKIAKR